MRGERAWRFPHADQGIGKISQAVIDPEDVTEFVDSVKLYELADAVLAAAGGIGETAVGCRVIHYRPDPRRRQRRASRRPLVPAAAEKDVIAVMPIRMSSALLPGPQ